MSRTRFGIIGCGGAAVPVCNAIAQSSAAELAVVHDTNQALAHDLSEQYHVPYTMDLDALLRNPDVDAVYIAVPHHVLAPLTGKALHARKHVLVEKPMALTVQDADTLIQRAEHLGLTLGVFFEMRYAPAFAQARELLHANVPGKVIGVRVQSLIDKKPAYWQAGYAGRPTSPWRGEKARAGGGVTLMNTSHLLDALWYMTGLNVTRVSAEYGTLVAEVEVEDTLSASLRFDNGALGSLFSGAHIRGASGEETIEIYGTEGTLRVPDPYQQQPMQVWLSQAHEDIPAKEWHALPTGRVNVFERAVDDFAQAVQDKASAPISGHDARRVLRTVLGLYRAADEQRAVEL